MDPIREKIIDLCLNEGLEGEALVEALEKQVSQILPFDHSIDNDFKACGLSSERLVLKIEKQEGGMSTMVESIENAGTKRALSIALFKNLVDSGEIGQEPDHGVISGTAEEAMGKLRSLVGSLFGDHVPDTVKKKLERLEKDLTDIDEDEFPDSPKRCKQPDNSECFKCPHTSICTKFK